MIIGQNGLFGSFLCLFSPPKFFKVLILMDVIQIVRIYCFIEMGLCKHISLFFYNLPFCVRFSLHITNISIFTMLFQCSWKDFMYFTVSILNTYIPHPFFPPSRYERFEVLAVFSCTMLAQLGSFFIIKERCVC